MSDSIEHTVTVALAPNAAFDLFTRDLVKWWPREYTWSRDVLVEIGMEQRLGGLCYEVGPHGFGCDWGRVLAWEPPTRLVLAWQISPRREPEPDPARASTVEVRFTERADGKTDVTLQHAGFERHGEGAEAYRAAMASPQGWPYILHRFTEAAA